jgi:hypothetical protein
MTVTSTHENYNCRHLYKIPSAENNSKLHIFTTEQILEASSKHWMEGSDYDHHSRLPRDLRNKRIEDCMVLYAIF